MTNLRTVAQRRHDLHKDDESSRPLAPDYELVGLTGEQAFGQAFGLPVDLSERRGGDRGVDFTTPAGTVDVKTSRRGVDLLVEVGKVRADLYVAARYDDKTSTARLLGWVYAGEVMAAPVIDLGRKVINHSIPVGQLRPMRDLAWLIDAEREG